MASHFGDRLCEAVKAKNTPLVVGLDPVYTRLPNEIRSHREMNDANDIGAAIDAIFDERLGIIVGSLLSGIFGYIILHVTLPKAR